MFSWFSFKKKSKAEFLLNYEQKIVVLEAALVNLRRSRPSYNLIIIIFFLIIFLKFIYDFALIYCLFFEIFSICLSLYFQSLIRKRNIRMTEYKLKALRLEQKDFVKQCKEDIHFDKTRELIEKYQDEESKRSFFSTIKRRSMTGFDSFADKIISNDPEKMNALICNNCGEHNGLIDPYNSNIDLFYCFSCKSKNIRNNNEE